MTPLEAHSNWSTLDERVLLHKFCKWANPGLFLFMSFLYDRDQIYIYKSVDGVLGTRTHCGRMEGVDKSTELWRHLGT